MSRTTRATLALTKLGVTFTLHAYDYDPDADRIGPRNKLLAFALHPRILCIVK